MGFEDTLKQTADDVDAMLSDILEFNGAAARTVIDAMRYSALGQGKRLRPFFVTEAAKLFDVERTHALRTGCAIECIHCYSLVHDDLPAMDDDDLRRGKPTTHIAFTEATAILAGDGLLTCAFQILSAPETQPEPQVRCELNAMLAQASGAEGMVGGQMLDLEAETRPSTTLDETVLLQGLKTGALFRFSCEAGAVLGQTGESDRAALRTYADRVGLAFQIADDLLDAESTAEELGKRTQKDAEAGKATFIDLLGLDGARARAREIAEEACAALEAYGAAAETLKQAAHFMVDRKK
jgi:farnesyl diphosphate synthase